MPYKKQVNVTTAQLHIDFCIQEENSDRNFEKLTQGPIDSTG